MFETIFRLLFLSTFAFLLSTSGSAQVIQQDSTKAIVQDTIPKKSNPKVDAIINYAKTFLGVPYRYGGTTPSGFDCSGFINFIFGNFGFSLVRTSYGLAELGETVALSDIQPGDLLFFKGSNVNSTSVGHVAMVIEVKDGSFKFIHSANGGVQITNFNTSRYYIQRYVKAKRLDYGGY
ncbi:MAG: NlpC/P60 family protein [Flavobacteriales bacterium]|jgi:cell wall-associated NlpC family hydrolase|nr:NlpC/P60 family protein [Crocinitomicaceae bacterium]NBX80347.1 NlpC/P60 family protein [Flavobacteriales bacterium]